MEYIPKNNQTMKKGEPTKTFQIGWTKTFQIGWYDLVVYFA